MNIRSTQLKLFSSYLLALSGSLWLSYQLRFDFNLPKDIRQSLPVAFTWFLVLKFVCLWRFRQFQVLVGYFSMPDFSRLFYCLVTATAISFVISTHLGSDYAPPRSVVLVDLSFSLIALTAARLVFRHLRTRTPSTAAHLETRRARRAGIIGAGLVGTALAEEFSSRPALGLKAVAFFDDDRSKWGAHLQNIPVIGPPEILLSKGNNLELEEIILAMPNAPATRVSQIVKILQQAQIKFTTVPSIYELTTGKAKVSQLRSVEIQDLLGREPVKLETEDIRQLLANKTVMVTGAGGSIGTELCRQIASYAPKSLLLVEKSEVQLFQVQQNLIDSGFEKIIIPLIADISDGERVKSILARYKPTILFHAAAHKHVPMLESQPGEAIKNNVFGTLRLAELALKHEIDRFVMISTDKAINPTNVMGASKRLAEICVQSLAAAHPNSTKFMAVRFGNVLGSSGSVVPIFQKQIAAGGPVCVTHPEVMRYFMTIPEAAGLVLQSAAQGSGGEIFLLDMGRPIKIVDLARYMIELSGLIPDEDIEIKFTGLRPGEKLFEELAYAGENSFPTKHPKILRLLCQPSPLKQVYGLLADLDVELDAPDANKLKLLLKRAVPEYQPQSSPGELYEVVEEAFPCRSRQHAPASPARSDVAPAIPVLRPTLSASSSAT